MSEAAAEQTPFWLQDNFAPVFEEVTLTDLKVTGEIPEALSGRLLRNGANPQTGWSDHWFLGNGMLHGVEIREGKANWYRMQAESANNFVVPLPLSMLCGALDLQIEHHLFPRLPTNRLREIAPEVEDICQRHGVKYRKASWGQTLRQALRQVWRLQREPEPSERSTTK